MARATVIIPTFGPASFARWAIKSVQQQTVKDLEICVICDGSPPEMVSLFTDMAGEDKRLRVFTFPKSPRTGEPYRDLVIRQTTGRIICYCSHDDLWLPHHVKAMEKSLTNCPFTHSIHAYVNVAEAAGNSKSILAGITWTDLDQDIIDKMQGTQGGIINYIPLTFGAHTRHSYYLLKEGWVTTPLDMPTDLHMWRKFLTAFREHCLTTMKITALNFRKMDRTAWTEQQRDDELKEYFGKIATSGFLRELYRQSLPTCPALFKKQYIRNSWGLRFPNLRIMH
jgi:GalNAc5-diNAcBac-PP-undecaprenol beta-1,3-glucosyltransferase